MTIDAADVVRRLRAAKANGNPNDYMAGLSVAEAHEAATLIETLERGRDEATKAAMIGTDTLRQMRRAEAAESALCQANARIAEMEGALGAASYLIKRQDAVSRGAKVRDLDKAWSRYISKRSELAVLHSQTEET